MAGSSRDAAAAAAAAVSDDAILYCKMLLAWAFVEKTLGDWRKTLLLAKADGVVE